MTRYIDAELAIKVANRYSLEKGSNYGRHSGIADAIVDEIEQLPAADVAPVRHGQWEKHEDSLFGKYYTCSECGLDIVPRDCFPKIETWYYCPFCGAKVRR